MSLKQELNNKLVTRTTAKQVLKVLTLEIGRNIDGSLNITDSNKRLPRVGRQLIVNVPQTREAVFFTNRGDETFFITVA